MGSRKRYVAPASLRKSKYSRPEAPAPILAGGTRVSFQKRRETSGASTLRKSNLLILIRALCLRLPGITALAVSTRVGFQTRRLGFGILEVTRVDHFDKYIPPLKSPGVTLCGKYARGASIAAWGFRPLEVTGVSSFSTPNF